MVHVVVGQGPVGATLAHHLAADGRDVVVVSRSGPTDLPAGARHVAADVAAPGALTAVARDLGVAPTAIYNCVNPPYHRWARDWPPLHEAFLDAAEATGAVLVTTGNLYGHGPGSGVMREDTPLAATETKGAVRAAMWRAARARHEASRVRATEVRASDYLGPRAGAQAYYGDRLLGPLLAGRPLRPLGDPDAPHAVAYLPDFARALAAAAVTPAAWGHPWLAPHHPAESLRQVAGRFARAAGLPTPTIRPISAPVLAAGAAFSPMLREVRRMSYQFTAPFETDSTRSEAALGLAPTPWEEITAATLAARR